MPSFRRKPGAIGRQLVLNAARAATGEVGWAFSRVADSEIQGPAARFDTDFAAALREVCRSEHRGGLEDSSETSDLKGCAA